MLPCKILISVELEVTVVKKKVLTYTNGSVEFIVTYKLCAATEAGKLLHPLAYAHYCHYV